MELQGALPPRPPPSYGPKLGCHFFHTDDFGLRNYTVMLALKWKVRSKYEVCLLNRTSYLEFHGVAMFSVRHHMVSPLSKAKDVTSLFSSLVQTPFSQLISFRNREFYVIYAIGRVTL